MDESRKSYCVAQSRQQSLYIAFGFALLMAILFLAAGCQSDFGDDLLILRDGATKQGRLDYCVAQTACTFNGKPVQRSSIQFIGFHGVKPPPPDVRDRLQDEVRLIDGSVYPNQVLGVDATRVTTISATHAREGVAWIYLARTEEPDRPTGAVPQGRRGPGSASEPEDKASYLWDGRIEVVNTYNGRNGRHKWTGEFLVKFLEVRDGGKKDGRPVSSFVPLELNYVIHADANWDKGSHALQRGANNAIIYGDVTMRGQASGAFTADQLEKGNMLGGDMITLDAPAGTQITAPTSFARFEHASGYMATDAPPGFYRLWGSLRSYQSELNWPHRSPERFKLLRDLYQGIDRGGQQPMWSSDANEDFMKWVLVERFYIMGHLGTPDQAELHGTYSEAGISFGGDDEGLITYSWVFKRTRK